MDYSKIYIKLTKRAVDRNIEGYVEKHHIIPKCMGGDDNPCNIVELTPEEHFLAHLLLVRIYPKNNKLIYAAQMMGSTRKSNKVYGWLKRQFLEANSGKNHPNYGRKHSAERRAQISRQQKGKKTLPETRLKMSQASKGRAKSKEHTANIVKAVSKQVKQIMGNKIIMEFQSITEAAKVTGVLRQSINKACKGIIRTAGGYTWSYLAPVEAS